MFATATAAIVINSVVAPDPLIFTCNQLHQKTPTRNCNILFGFMRTFNVVVVVIVVTNNTIGDNNKIIIAIPLFTESAWSSRPC